MERTLRGAGGVNRHRGRFYPIGDEENSKKKNKMTEIMRIFMLLLRKNFLVRKKHWGQTLLIQIGISVGLFVLAEVIRLAADDGIVVIDQNTYHNKIDEAFILQDFSQTALLRYTPDLQVTHDLMESVRDCLKMPRDRIFGSADEATMLAEFARDESVEKEYDFTPIGIVFETIVNNTLPTILKYKLRTSSLRVPRELYDPLENGDRANDIMANDQLLPVQLCLDKAFIKNVTYPSSNSYTANISIQQMPYPPYNQIGLVGFIGAQALAEFARLMLIIVTCVEITFPANEKNIGVNILMSVNGVKNQMNLLSWLVSGVIWSTSYLLPIVLLLKFFLPPYVAAFLDYGNPFIVWLALVLQAIQTICFGYHISAYFWKPSFGIFATFMISGLMNVVKNFSTGTSIRHFLLYLGIFSPNFLLDRIFSEINAYERQLTGVGFLNMFVVGSSDSPREASMGVLLIFSILGALFHFYMAIYVHAIRPGKYGVKQHPLFCIQKTNKVQENQSHLAFEDFKIEKKEFETVPEGSLEPGIRIRGLKKSYTTDWIKETKVHALKGVSVDFYKSQITALLGHNGAGKTTMMSILSGLVGSTEGVVFIDGKNIQLEPETIRNNIGLCPQENIVFPDLNVHEQLMFFGTMKAAEDKSKRQLEEEVDILLAKVNLTDKKHALPSQLSGGQKRRLCLAMAVIGDANVLILDEPTSGMDAESKREVWDIILKMRGYKTILISTHDMEEADILGDRIAIMHSGKLKSYGTAMFLKKLYGDGQVEVTLSVESGCNPSKIFQEIEINVQVLSEGDGKIVLAIPRSESLPAILDKLETSKKKLGITGMSVSIITLEQVFLKITKEEGDEIDAVNNPIRSFEKTTGFDYFMQTFWGYLLKKIAYSRKNPWTFWMCLLLPCAASLLLFLAFGSKASKAEAINLTLNAYSSSIARVHSDRLDLSSNYLKTIDDFGGTAKVVEQGTSVTDALLNYATENKVIYRNKMIVSAEFNGTGPVVLANGFFSGSAIRGIPITINCISNTLLKAMTNNEKMQIHISTQQLPRSVNSEEQNADAATVTLSMIIFLAPAVAYYITQPLREATTGIKQLQDMTGASKISYWGSMFLFDYVQYTISVLLLLASFVFVDILLKTQFYHRTEILLFFAFLMLFGLGCLPLIYAISFWKLTQNASMIILSLSPMVLGFIDTILAVLSITLNSDIYNIIRDIQKQVFLLIPQLSFIYGHWSFFEIVVLNARCRRMTDNIIAAVCSASDGRPIIDECCSMECSGGVCKKPKSYFTSNIFGSSLGESMAYLVASSVIFFIFIFIFEQQIIDKILVKIRRKNLATSTAGMDELVKKEKALVAEEIEKRVQNQVEDENENVFLAHELKKNYGNLQVVKGISFRVKEGECFGLLGVNGAGKSTTFKMLTGEEIPHDGSMYLKHFGIHDNREKYLAEMGYCPQQDAIIDTLNAWDHLILFARLRGVPQTQINFVVKNWITKLNLTACAAQPSGTYSGGNKRRLNIAIALIGNPSLVLMDEPTTGVDPAARRSLWNTLKYCQEFGQSIILTSHSMEECEVLCNRLVIMVKGQIVCVGAVQELKQRFGAGYNIHVKMSPVSREDDFHEIKRRIESGISCQKMDENSGFLGYHVTDPQATWTFMYGLMNELKNNFDCIEDFAVLSSTLEQLFIQFARAPEDAGNGQVSRNWWRETSPGSPV